MSSFRTPNLTRLTSFLVKCQILSIDEPESVDAGVTSVAISPDGRHVAAGSLDTVVRIWDVATGTLVERLMGHTDSVYSVSFTPDGKGLLSGSLDKTLKYWDVSQLGRKQERGVGIGKVGESSAQCVKDFRGHRVSWLICTRIVG